MQQAIAVSSQTNSTPRSEVRRIGEPNIAVDEEQRQRPHANEKGRLAADATFPAQRLARVLVHRLSPGAEHLDLQCGDFRARHVVPSQMPHHRQLHQLPMFVPTLP